MLSFCQEAGRGAQMTRYDIVGHVTEIAEGTWKSQVGYVDSKAGKWDGQSPDYSISNEGVGVDSQ